MDKSEKQKECEREKGQERKGVREGGTEPKWEREKERGIGEKGEIGQKGRVRKRNSGREIGWKKRVREETRREKWRKWVMEVEIEG